MKIGVLGTGKVAHAIASHWVRGGHDVLFGNREGVAPDGDFPAGSRFGALEDAAAHGEVVLLAIPASAMEDAVKALADTLGGKILFDCSNGLSPVDHHQDLPDISGAEEIAQWAPAARVVKIFNTTGFENLADPLFAGEPATMFYATDDKGARGIAHELAAECGFDPIYAGPLIVARDLEWLTRIWGKLAFGQKLGRRIAFRLLKAG
jgi:predicted dinucleotide-binding enzyme